MRDDAGSSSLEFIAVGVIMLVPLLYLVIAVGSVQEQTLGVEAAARQAARAVASAPDIAAAADRGEEVLDGVVAEYGIDPGAVDVAVSCRPRASACPAAGATVVVTVSTRVPLPLVPGVLGLDQATSVPVEAVSVQKVSRRWGAG
ncbi:TadE family protein [Microbacterium paraoxydans]|jgi:Flp pilus assembly protein TadG|uniref:TadE family protein n=1 Tax=Microbacterium TaxID=33882 RepID=UPI001F1982F0|nr:TadE family protein [Microbacterium sp. str. 'China']